MQNHRAAVWLPWAPLRASCSRQGRAASSVHRRSSLTCWSASASHCSRATRSCCSVLCSRCASSSCSWQAVMCPSTRVVLLSVGDEGGREDAQATGSPHGLLECTSCTEGCQTDMPAAKVHPTHKFPCRSPRKV